MTKFAGLSIAECLQLRRMSNSFYLVIVLCALTPTLTFSSFRRCLLCRCLLDHGIVVGRAQSRDTNKRMGFILMLGSFGHSSEGQVIMLQDGEAVLRLLLLQVEHLPQLLQLLQLAEGLQHHQHDYQAQDKID